MFLRRVTFNLREITSSVNNRKSCREDPTVNNMESNVASTDVIPGESNAASTDVTPGESNVASTDVTPGESNVASTDVTPGESNVASTDVTPGESNVASTDVTPGESNFASTDVTPGESNVASTDVTPGEREITCDDVIEAQDINCQPSDGSERSQLAHNISQEINSLTPETETSGHLDKNPTEHLDVAAEDSSKPHGLISKGPDNTIGSENTSNKQLYSYNIDLVLESIYQETDVSVNPATVRLLTDGFITQFLPPLLKAQSSVNQVKSSQSVLIETVQQEISKFTDCQAITDLKDTMTKARQYHNKLLKLRREMTDLHEKSKRLKKRALKLQQQKQKEELTRAHNLEKEFEKERMLTARVASSHD